MNIASALINRIILEQDTETWGNLQLHYLPPEYQSIHRIISTHLKNFNQLPTFEDLTKISSTSQYSFLQGRLISETLFPPTLIYLETLYKVNVSIAAEINRLVLPSMVEQKKGFVVHVGSVASQEATASVGYNTVKASLAAYVRSLGREMAHTGVIITGILPGAFYGEDNSMFRFEYYKPEEYG